VAVAALELDAQCIGIGDHASCEEGCDFVLNALLPLLAGGAGTVAYDSVFRFDSDQHRVTLEYRALPAIVREFGCVGQGIGKKEGLDGADLH
jgi:hypothetical protein